MARYEVETNAPLYDVAQQWVEVALSGDGSLFTPGRRIWCTELLDELDERFIQHPDAGTSSFEQKLHGQLEGASPGAIQLMAEVLYVHYLPAFYNVKGDSKRAKINEVLSWSPTPVAMPAELSRVLDLGVGSGGPGFHLYRPSHIQYLITFVEEWKRLAEDERRALLEGPWRFREFAHRIHSDSNASYAREALLHIVFPDFFDRFLSFGEKYRVAEAISPVLEHVPASVDERVYAIRQYLTPRLGEGFDFYDSLPARVLWTPLRDRWGTFLYWGSLFHGDPKFDEWERTYKIAIAGRLAEARDALRSGSDDWLSKLKVAFDRQNNLTDYRAHGPFLAWCGQHRDEAAELLTSLWEPTDDPLARLDAFLQELPAAAVRGPGTRANIASFLLMPQGVEDYPPFKWEATMRAWTITGFGPPAVATDPSVLYRHAIAFWDLMRERGASRGLRLRDRLDAQSASWTVTNWGDDELPESWPPEDKAAMRRYHELMKSGAGVEEEEESTEPPDDVEAVEATPIVPADPLIALADELLIAHRDLAEIRDLLEAKGQVVFYGPPGTGKTFVARKLATALAGSPERVKLVQFHASYAYEDFVEGYRPQEINGHPGFERKPGPFLRLAEAARTSPDLHVLIVDEMNRGNVAKVLGELYFLLEYRDEPVELPYSGREFRLPKNVRIIGTMNTADRSIALVDAALRRRFAFIPFFPDRPPIAGLLDRWLARYRPEMRWVARLVDLANYKLADRNSGIGPSFFLRSDLDDRRLELIWRHEITPYLEEFFFDDPARLDAFTLETLRAELRGPATDQLAETSDDLGTPDAR